MGDEQTAALLEQNAKLREAAMENRYTDEQFSYEDRIICGPRNVKIGSNPNLMRRKLAIDIEPDAESRALIVVLLAAANRGDQAVKLLRKLSVATRTHITNFGSCQTCEENVMKADALLASLDTPA